MRMDEHARAWTHEFVTGVLTPASLNAPQRNSLHWEIVNHVHEAAARRVEERRGDHITLADVQAVIQDMGGRPGIASMFLEQRVAATPRATFGKRLGAFLVDLVVFVLIVGSLSFVTGVLLEPFLFTRLYWYFDDLFGFFSVALGLAYLALMEFRFGATVGKMAFRLRAVMEDGRPITIEAALVRNVAKVIPPLLLLDALLWLVAFKHERQRASDRIAKTVVIDTEQASWSVPAPAMPPAEPAPPRTFAERVNDIRRD